MIRIEKIQFINFGPYYGTNEITFDEGDGVTIVWGENGYGKTSIMNGFRYVLWGHLLNRKRQELSPYAFVNTNAVAEGKDMSVVLEMTNNGNRYTIYRGLHRAKGDGKRQEDYETIFAVTKDGEPMTKADSEKILFDALPYKTSRFYLFDGELLAEYEDLLDDTDESGDKIKQSIEDILGLPILENARENLDQIKFMFNKQASEAGKKNEESKQLSISLSKAQEKKEELEKSGRDLNDQLTKEKANYESLTEKLKNNATFSELISKKEEAKHNIDRCKEEIESIENDISEMMDNAWRYLLNSLIDQQIDSYEDSIKALEEKAEAEKSAEYLFDFLTKKFKEEGITSCPVCGDHLDEAKKEEILSNFKSQIKNSVSEEEKEMLTKIRHNINLLNSYKVESKKELMKLQISRINKLNTEILTNEAKLNNIGKEIDKLGATATQDEIKELPKLLKASDKVIGELKKGISDNEVQLSNCKNAIVLISKKLEASTSDPNLKLYIKRQNLADMTEQLFDESISNSREKLKDSVQNDASIIFRSISHEPEYDHLVINDNYGLEIRLSDDSPVPNRSAGYEQVVAISLISALHKNAPIEGPIFMDSTFQRVDSDHKLNTLKSLPKFGSQVIVLAYSTEIGNQSNVRAILGNKLTQEYQLEHPRSTITTIKKL